MLRLIKYLRGYVRIRISGFSPERFMNLCCNRGILIWKAVRYKNDYEMYLSIHDFFKLSPILKKTGTRVTVLERHGLPFFMHRYQRRKFFPAGILFCMIFLFTMSLFIWEIRIEGNCHQTDDMIEDYLAELHIYPGIMKSQINCETIEKGLRQKYDDITWTSARIEGTCLEIMIKENELLPMEHQEEKPCDLIAEEDGIITKIITRSGVPMCMEGTRVEKGMILVSGAIPIMNDSKEITDYQYVHADADIRIKTELTYRDTFEMNQSHKIYTGHEKKEISFSTAQYCYSIRSNIRDDVIYDSYTVSTPIHIFKDFHLPVWLNVRHRREYYESNSRYTSEEAIQFAKKKLQNYCHELSEKGVQIIANSVKIDFVNHFCKSFGKLTVIQDAGAEHDLTIPTEELR